MHGVFTCAIAEKSRFLSRGKILRKKEKKGLFGAEIESFKNIVKATPEEQYNCSMQSKWFKRTANI